MSTTGAATGTSAARRAQYGGGSTVRGQRTRALLLAAAREVFERDGYVEARVADIVALARVSHGTFYTYFPSKQHAFRAVAAQVNDEITAAVGLTPDGDGRRARTAADLVHRLDQANRRFLDTYRKNRVMMMLIEQVATIDPEVGAYRLETRRVHTDRIAAKIRRLQAKGLADRELDPRTAAAALTSMIGNFAYHWLAMGEPFDDELAKTTLTRLWIGALGLPVTPST